MDEVEVLEVQNYDVLVFLLDSNGEKLPKAGLYNCRLSHLSNSVRTDIPFRARSALGIRAPAGPGPTPLSRKERQSSSLIFVAVRQMGGAPSKLFDG
ncbi:hypothetical protein EVAR_103120_1 [Eumeta japonica]|uniref:Uncharacterized protein n=1 Tax=Eumeta variegata TaxID=151549 RepID=A0A4C1X3F7_EUMVA|nr:hypothetical protein EVAR_103120_1 [Eumeta japonica]